MSNTELVQMLADGYTVREIAVKKNLKYGPLQKRIFNLRKDCLCLSVAHLVMNYSRKRLIK